LAFITAAAALELWRNQGLADGITERSAILSQELCAIAADHSKLQLQVRGIGLLFGLQVERAEIARLIARECFNQGLLVELCGAHGNVLKFLPPLVIEPDVLREGLNRVRTAIQTVLKENAAG